MQHIRLYIPALARYGRFSRKAAQHGRDISYAQRRIANGPPLLALTAEATAAPPRDERTPERLRTAPRR